jgi:hypothetical protein
MSTWVVGDVQGCKKAFKLAAREDRFQLGARPSSGVHRGYRQPRAELPENPALLLQAPRENPDGAGQSRPAPPGGRLGGQVHGPQRYPGADPGGAGLQELLNWLRFQPLLHHEAGFTMVHAGIPPQWSVAEAALRAREVEAVLRSDRAGEFFSAMYGNEPVGVVRRPGGHAPPASYHQLLHAHALL